MAEKVRFCLAAFWTTNFNLRTFVFVVGYIKQRIQWGPL